MTECQGAAQATNPCAACGRKTGRRRRRRLCEVCYAQPDVRSRFAPVKARSRSALHGRHDGLPLPYAPTDAEPGSDLKIDILQARVRAKQQLFHPRDLVLPRRWERMTGAEVLRLLELLEFLNEAFPAAADSAAVHLSIAKVG